VSKAIFVQPLYQGNKNIKNIRITDIHPKGLQIVNKFRREEKEQLVQVPLSKTAISSLPLQNSSFGNKHWGKTVELRICKTA